MLNAGDMNRALAILFAISLLFAATVSTAADYDVALAEARAGSCTSFEGAAFVFCVALCEARTCDARDPADQRCAVLRRGFGRVAGGQAPPCEGSVLAKIAVE